MKSNNLIVVFSFGVYLAGNSHSGHWGTPTLFPANPPLNQQTV